MQDPTFPWLTTLIVVPLVGALVVWALPGSLRRHSRMVALVVSLVALGLGAAATLSFDMAAAGTQQLTEQAAWIPAFGVSYAVGVNGVGLSLVLLSVLLVPLVLLAAWREHPDAVPGAGTPAGARAAVSDDLTGDTAVGPTRTTGATALLVRRSDRVRHYVALVLVLEAFMVAVFAARDVFLFYVLFEAMLIPVYFMIGAFGGLQRRYAAVKFLLFSLVGGLIMLVGVIALYLNGPGGPEGFLIDNLVGTELPVTTERLLFLAFFFAFAIKAPMWPVHTWLPDAAEQAPAGTSVLLVGVLDKVGTFGMLTLCLPLFPNASRWAAPVIIVLAVISILYGALLAIGQADLMRLIAYTSVSHFGFIVLGIFAFTSVSVQGASLYMVNHGLSTGALFLLAGFLVARRGTARIADYGGLQKVTPILAGTFLVAGLSALSLPGLSTFVSEFLVLVGTYASNPAAAVVATLGVVLAAIYVLLTYQRIFTGPVRTARVLRAEVPVLVGAGAPVAAAGAHGATTHAPDAGGSADDRAGSADTPGHHGTTEQGMDDHGSSEPGAAAEAARTPDLSAREMWVVGPLIAAMLVLGFYPAPALDLVRDPATTTLQQVGVEDAASDPTTTDGSDK